MTLEYPTALAAELLHSERPDPERVKELVTASARIYECYAELKTEVAELRRDLELRENTIRLLSAESE